MPRTKLHQKKGVTDQLNDKQRRFVQEYVIDYNATRAARAAGYSHPHVYGQRLVADGNVMRVVAEIQTRDLTYLQLTRERILEELYYCATRSITDYVDDKGFIQQNVKKLSKKAAAAVDGITQHVTQNRDGSVTTTTELKLVGKAKALDLAMKHKGLFAVQQVEMKHSFDWDSLYAGGEETPEPDVIEGRIRVLELMSDDDDAETESN